MRVIATKGWQASYADPIRLRAGEAPRLSGREDIWDGHRWLWAVAEDGREGWVPDTLVSPEGRAVREYSALELGCAVGEEMEAVTETHGWTLCRNAEGAEGWVPSRHLRAL
ncbi:hypothetical protein GCM10011534_28810 [Pseudooceanicola nanhaiensis]|jgi:SH3-like domain-containing protein|uniref:SH3 domain-containing protein n=1 Tax=Pseudooceanicola nanhaiensis TaxID=375761 RepID=A0A917T0V6_9RHOB|nr:SH3 domain-containing protein [Pseudooceanicola nanhaiensis]GGM05240.1 hypothetical protein GCM10011534_28810 [Pseudooceanicola nanhaiensis]